jgi:hypothetical protein
MKAAVRLKRETEPYGSGVQVPEQILNRVCNSVKLLSGTATLDALKLTIKEIFWTCLRLEVVRIRLVHDLGESTLWSPNRTVNCFPIAGKTGETVAFVFAERNGAAFQENDRLFLKHILPHIGIALERSLKQERLIDEMWRLRQQQLNESVCRTFCNAIPRNYGGVQLHALPIGDLPEPPHRDFVALGEDRFALAIGLLHPEETPAAQITGWFMTMVHTVCCHTASLAKAIQSINQELVETGSGRWAADLVLMSIDARQRLLEWVRAGDAALTVTVSPPEKENVTEDQENPPLGIVRYPKYSVHSFKAQAGSLVSVSAQNPVLALRF